MHLLYLFHKITKTQTLAMKEKKMLICDVILPSLNI